MNFKCSFYLLFLTTSLLATFKMIYPSVVMVGTMQFIQLTQHMTDSDGTIPFSL